MSIGLIAALVGLYIANYIYRTKQQKKKLMCSRSAPCEEVISSAYATTFGVSNALLGQIYYAIMALLFIASVLPAFLMLQEGIVLLLWVGATFGLLFSLYLVSIQAFVLKVWCRWCLGSALCASAVFVAMFLVG